MIETPINHSVRVTQLRGMFDLNNDSVSRKEWDLNFDYPDNWNIGLIVGPSGCGKTQIAKNLFADHVVGDFDWSDDDSILDSFPENLSIKYIVSLLSSVGFSSPPSWLKPYRILSTGEQFRVRIARALSEDNELIVMDEFTSVIDRTVARIGCSAVQKSIRKYNRKLIALSCHYDIVNWLQPDWIYEPHKNLFVARCPRRRPNITLQIKRVHHSNWELFREYHYLNSSLNRSARCFCAFWNDVPVAFAAILHHPLLKGSFKREHRLVCLPDYQGVGIGNELSSFMGSLCKALRFRYMSITSHPAMICSRMRNPFWRLTAKPNIKSQTIGSNMTGLSPVFKTVGQAKRFRATFEYIGKAMNYERAVKLWSE
jgi:ABC-type dipeptide/oligopeptide/nickel transport system ATPase subunit